ncbi:MAG: PASTA domain-containing protein [Planctomycetota bacterium]|nr:PASTA domain-containing protein [Planctomycetota bacterium]
MFRFLPLLLAVAMLPLGLLGPSPALADETVTAVEVPGVIGKSEAEARALLEERGLLADISYVDDDVAPAGTVISQDPKSGSEILVGATIQLRVIGPAPDAEPQDDGVDAPETDQVAVPALTGLALKDAEAALIALGLTPRPDFIKSDAQPAFHVIGQDLPADSLVAAGTHVRFEVALGVDAPTTLFLPSLYGLSEADALAVLAQLGLDAQILRVHSNLPQGQVFHQSPAAGTEVALDELIQLKVAEKPPVDWTPKYAIVPNLKGMSADQARIALLVRGLRSRLKLGMKPNANVHKVFSQNKPAGSKLLVGERVTFYLPYKGLVPSLIGKTKAQATAALNAAGLSAQASGPHVGVPPTKVIAQNKPAGSTIARGSTVKFTYKFTGVIQLKVPVPHLLGKTKAHAKALVESKGLTPKLVGPNFGIGGTKVTQQFPAAGTMVFKNTQVTIKYKFTGAIGVKVAVPNVVGKTKAQAKALIENKGLNAKMVGPNFGIGGTKVTQQFPAAGTMVLKNTQVTAKYKFTGAIGVKVTVPNVVGKTKAQAKALIEAKGLKIKLVGPAAGIGIAKVYQQFPAAGTKLLKGSQVTAKFKFQGAIILPKVTVPNLVGKTKIQAQLILQSKGLKAQFSGVGNKVKTQNRAPGSKVIKGTTVKMTLKF